MMESALMPNDTHETAPCNHHPKACLSGKKRQIARLGRRSETFSLRESCSRKRLKPSETVCSGKGRKEIKVSSKPKTGVFQAAFARPMSEEARAQKLFNKQKAYFASDATKSYEWRIDQLDRLIRMLKDNYERFSNASWKDFKTATQENVFEVSASIATAEFTKSQLKEWMKPVEAPIPSSSPHRGTKESCTGSRTALR